MVNLEAAEQSQALCCLVRHKQNCQLNYSNCKIGGLNPKNTGWVWRRGSWKKRFNLQTELICTECNWKRTNTEFRDDLFWAHFWYLLTFFFFFPIKDFPLSSLEKRIRSTKLEIIQNSTVVWKTVILGFERFLLIIHQVVKYLLSAYFLQGAALALGLRIYGK